jgi:hypothetical protein
MSTSPRAPNSSMSDMTPHHRRSSVADDHHDHEQSDEESDDIEAITLVTGAILNNMWIQLSMFYPQRSAEQWKRLDMDESLPVSEAERVVASPATRTVGHSRLVGGIQPSNQTVQLPRTQVPAPTAVVNGRHAIPPSGRTLDSQHGESPSDVLPPERSYIEQTVTLTSRHSRQYEIHELRTSEHCI